MREDGRLIRAMRRGSREAVERRYEKYAGSLLTVALALCHRLDAAEDIVHDFFVSFVQSAETLKAHSVQMVVTPNGNVVGLCATLSIPEALWRQLIESLRETFAPQV